MNRSVWMVAVVMGLSVGSLRAETFTIDPYHSTVSFKIKHVVGKVDGRFDKFTGSFTYEDGKPASWTAMAAIDPSSVNTGIDKRDTHLKSPDFFDVAKFPTMSFTSTSVTDVQGMKGKLHGNLTMHGVTKPVDLDLEVTGTAKDPMGKGMRAGASATGHVNRADFGIGATTGPIASMVGQDVEISIDIEGVSK